MLEAGGSAGPTEMVRTPLVDLPLGATEDRVCGTIDFERALTEGEREMWRRDISEAGRNRKSSGADASSSILLFAASPQASRLSSLASSPRPTAASFTWTRSTCSTTTWWTCCWTRPRRAGTRSSARASPSATPRASSSSAAATPRRGSSGRSCWTGGPTSRVGLTFLSLILAEACCPQVRAACVHQDRPRPLDARQDRRGAAGL